MTAQQPQPSWQRPPAQSQPPPPPPTRKRWSTTRIVLVVVGAILGLFLLIGVIGALAGTEPASTTRPATQAATATAPPLLSQPTSPPATDPPAPTYATPKPRDFKLTVKVLEKQNFGSAGSNITYRIVADWSKTYDPATTYDVTYEVRGGEDGAAVNTFTVTGDEYQVEREEFISTATVGARLSARVTSVEEA